MTKLWEVILQLVSEFHLRRAFIKSTPTGATENKTEAAVNQAQYVHAHTG